MTNFLIISIAFYIIICIFVLSLKKPVLYVWFYLLASTKFLGFVDVRAFEIQGIFNVMFYLNIITICSILAMIIEGKSLGGRGFWFLLVIAGLVSFGVLYPFVLGYSTIVSSVTDGKDFLCYFFLGYLLINTDKIKIDAVYDVVRTIGLGLSFIAIIARVIAYSPPAFPPIDTQLGPRYGIHLYFPTFICLAFLIEFAYFLEKGFILRRAWIIIILTIGLILQGYRSVFLSTMAVTVLLCIYMNYRSPLTARIKMFVTISALTVSLILTGSSHVEKALFSPIEEVLQQKGSVASKISYNYFRWDAIKKRPFLGYGFIDESSKFGKRFYFSSHSRFTQALGVVDAGYIDALVRFGIIGTIVLLGLYIFIIIVPFRVKKYSRIERVVPVFFIASYFAISLTLSVFSYQHGIIPATIAIYLILSPEGTYEAIN